MRIPSILTLLLTIACSAGTKPLGDVGLGGESDRPAWDPDPQTIDNGSSSSTVSWTPPDEEDGQIQTITMLLSPQSLAPSY